MVSCLCVCRQSLSVCVSRALHGRVCSVLTPLTDSVSSTILECYESFCLSFLVIQQLKGIVRLIVLEIC
jgi:hypothetical protein